MGSRKPFRGVHWVLSVMCASCSCSWLIYGRLAIVHPACPVPPQCSTCTRIDDCIRVTLWRCELPNVGATGLRRFGRGWLGTNHPSLPYHDIVEDTTITVYPTCTGLSDRRKAWAPDLSLREEPTPRLASFLDPKKKGKVPSGQSAA